MFPELGESSPLLCRVLNALDARIEDGKLVIPAVIRGDEVEVKARYARFVWTAGAWQLPMVRKPPDHDPTFGLVRNEAGQMVEDDWVPPEDWPDR